METMEKLNKVNFSLDTRNLEKSVKETTEKIKRVSELMDYRITSDLSEIDNCYEKLVNLSLNQKKN